MIDRHPQVAFSIALPQAHLCCGQNEFAVFGGDRGKQTMWREEISTTKAT
jgi:hypothetical protein